MFGETRRLRARVESLAKRLEDEQQRSSLYCQRITELEELLQRSASMMADYRVQLTSALELIARVRSSVSGVPLVFDEMAG